jgi:prepilin-type N-terminal cleavage/methylation domain-containing protein
MKPRAPCVRGGRGAFSIIEVLVVIAIIAALLAIALPILGNVRRSGRRAACGANLRMIGVALSSYRSEHGECPAVAATPLPWIEAPALSDALGPFVDAPLPEQQAGGEYLSPAPWRCPADPGLHAAIGTSYEYRLSMLAIALAADGVPNPWRAASQRSDAPPDVPIVGDASNGVLAAMKVEGDWHPATSDGWRQALFGDGRVSAIP